MMVGRQAALDRNASAPRGRRGSLNLGPLDALLVSLPRVVEIAGQRFRILELEGELVAHSTLCPHRLGPLDAAPVEDGRIRCPWHGYVFEVRSGANSQGRPCRLAPAPQLRIDPDRRNVELSWDAA